MDIEKYSYAGPKPQTKIAAILMIADAGEAAVRTLKDRTRENVDALLSRLINERMQLRPVRGLRHHDERTKHHQKHHSKQPDGRIPQQDRISESEFGRE